MACTICIKDNNSQALLSKCISNALYYYHNATAVTNITKIPKWWIIIDPVANHPLLHISLWLVLYFSLAMKEQVFYGKVIDIQTWKMTGITFNYHVSKAYHYSEYDIKSGVEYKGILVKA